jgi:hypothetical protein
MSERRNRFIRLALWLLVLLGFAAAVKAGINRANVEKTNRRVEIALDFNELRVLAAIEGKPLSEVLDALKNAAGPGRGATSVAIQEDTISSLEEAQILKERRRAAVARLCFTGRRKRSRVSRRRSGSRHVTRSLPWQPMRLCPSAFRRP